LVTMSFKHRLHVCKAVALTVHFALSNLEMGTVSQTVFLGWP
jgi:hypothetical protein